MRSSIALQLSKRNESTQPVRLKKKNATIKIKGEKLIAHIVSNLLVTTVKVDLILSHDISHCLEQLHHTHISCCDTQKQCSRYLSCAFW